MTDDNTSIPEISTPIPEEASVPKLDTAAAPEPRITNNMEGKKKQKEAVKRLSEYSRGVASRKVEPVANDPPLEASPTAPSDSDHEVPQPESTMSVSNVVAAAGVIVAIVCLYLSYRPDKSGGDEKLEESKVPEERPKAPSTPKSSRSSRSIQEPKFRHL